MYLPQFTFLPKSLKLKRVFLDFGIDNIDFEQDFPDIRLNFNSKLSELSGGELRLIEVFLIIKSKTKFVLLDEPFSHIMPLHIEKIKQILTKEKENKGILMTDHMYKHITDISDNLYILSNGKVQQIKEIDDIERLGYARL